MAAAYWPRSQDCVASWIRASGSPVSGGGRAAAGAARPGGRGRRGVGAVARGSARAGAGAGRSAGRAGWRVAGVAAATVRGWGGRTSAWRAGAGGAGVGVASAVALRCSARAAAAASRSACFSAAACWRPARPPPWPRPPPLPSSACRRPWPPGVALLDHRPGPGVVRLQRGHPLDRRAGFVALACAPPAARPRSGSGPPACSGRSPSGARPATGRRCSRGWSGTASALPRSSCRRRPASAGRTAPRPASRESMVSRRLAASAEVGAACRARLHGSRRRRPSSRSRIAALGLVQQSPAPRGRARGRGGRPTGSGDADESLPRWRRRASVALAIAGVRLLAVRPPEGQHDARQRHRRDRAADDQLAPVAARRWRRRSRRSRCRR